MPKVVTLAGSCRHAKWHIDKWTDHEKLSFSFVCFGFPLLSEIKSFCHAYQVNFGKIQSALYSLSEKGLIKGNSESISNHGTSLQHLIIELTPIGNKVLQRNLPHITDFLVARWFSHNPRQAVQTLVKNFVEDFRAGNDVCVKIPQRSSSQNPS